MEDLPRSASPLKVLWWEIHICVYIIFGK